MEDRKKNMMVVIDEKKSNCKFFIWVLENLKDLIESSKLYVLATQPFPVFTSSVFAAPLAHPGAYRAFSTSAELNRMVYERNMKVSLGLLERAKRICASRGIEAETMTEAGEAKEVICRAVQEQEIDLLVIAKTEQGFLQRVFQGNLSKYCLDNAKCSVFVVKKDAYL